MFIASQSTFTAAEKITLNACRATDTSLTGLIAGTLLETAAGWRPVESLMQGDEIYTYDGGLRAIDRLERNFVDAAEAAPEGLVLIPGGILSNSEDLLVLPDQKLLIETKALGGVAALVRARQLAEQGDVAWVRTDRQIQVVRPVFAEQEILWANSGLLFHCAGSDDTPGFFRDATAGDIRKISKSLFSSTADSFWSVAA